MKKKEWREAFLQRVESSCEEGQAAAAYLRARGVPLDLRRARKNIGAFWLPTGSVFLNAEHYSYESALNDAGAWALLIHEACHLRQGFFTAFSIYGELEAWQLQWRALQKMTGQQQSPILADLLALPLSRDVATLRRARALMTAFAGFWYGAYFYPLRPLF
ncbi:MAG: hypothetical protein Fur002_18460 [Anaerolineales bacterium]